MRTSETYAQLAVKNVGSSFLRKCDVRLIGVDSVVHRAPIPGAVYPARLLRWSSRERAAYGDEHEWLDFPADAIERFLDVAVLDQIQHLHLDYCRLPTQLTAFSSVVDGTGFGWLFRPSQIPRKPFAVDFG